MTKDEAVKKMVDGFSGIPQEWVRIVLEHYGEYHALPVWGTMFIVDFWGEKLYKNARVMLGDKSELYEEYANDKESLAIIEKAIAENDWCTLENYIDEEMSGERCILDKDGNTTAMFIYEIDGNYVIGINGAGWDFYSGVWDKLYDIIGLQWNK
jgi:hypothetical protein